MAKTIKLHIITGLSGSGKTIVLHTLEDLGYYCIDNLPVFLLETFADRLEQRPEEHFHKTAVGIDARSQLDSSEELSDLAQAIRGKDIDCEIIFLETETETLIKRFSETRRKHPLTNDKYSLEEAIQRERELLEPLRNIAKLRIDTTHTNMHELRDMIRAHVASEQQQATVRFESFGFKHGVPRNVDFVFDVRCLPNPYWQTELRPFTGVDEPVANFLNESPEAQNMLADLTRFLETWISQFEADGRTSLTIGIGCTGGQHRSVYITDQLYRRFKEQGSHVLARHREL